MDNMNVEEEIRKLESEEINVSKWIKYFLKELKFLKSEIEAIKEREEILGKTILKLYDKKPED